uniref:Uncharacterized protein n=1 Tax=Neobodo designis TaxID=312471 RepID=A0A7S1LL34_NEODS
MPLATPDFGPPPVPVAPRRSPSATARRRPQQRAGPQVPRSRPTTPISSRAPTPERCRSPSDVAADDWEHHRSVSCASSFVGRAGRSDDGAASSTLSVGRLRFLQRGRVDAPPIATPFMDDEPADSSRDARNALPAVAVADDENAAENYARSHAPPIRTPASPQDLTRLRYDNGAWVPVRDAQEWGALFRTQAAVESSSSDAQRHDRGVQAFSDAGTRPTPSEQATRSASTRTVEPVSQPRPPVLCSVRIERDDDAVPSHESALRSRHSSVGQGAFLTPAW